MDIAKITIKSALESLSAKEFSATELVESCINKAKENEHLNIFITQIFDDAIKQAKEADKKISTALQQGKNIAEIGLLAGIPVAIKDLFCTKNTRTTAASKILANFTPPYESSITANILKQGAISLGKVNMDEFAMGSANITSFFGNSISPLKSKDGKQSRVPGGSSGGSAVAVASGSSLFALGTDTGGSIRQPASFCGVVGMKPTYGRCSRWGTIAFASSLDQAGPITKTVEDAAIALQAMAGFDEKDSTSSRQKVPNWFGEISTNIKGKKIGVPSEYLAYEDKGGKLHNLPPSIEASLNKAIKTLQAAGAEIQEVSLPHTKYALPVYYIIASAEASSNLARYDGVRFGHRTEEPFANLEEMYEKTRGEAFGKEVKRRVLIGSFVLSHGYYDAYYTKAQKVRGLIAEDFKKAFNKLDAILTPTTPSSAFEIGKDISPIEMYFNDVFTVPASLAGLPAISVPFGKCEESLPLGMQIIGNYFDEQTIFNIASNLEQESTKSQP